MRHTSVWWTSQSKIGRTVLIFLESEHILCGKFLLITLASETQRSAEEESVLSPLMRSLCRDSSSLKRFWRWMRHFPDWNSWTNARARLLSFASSAALQRKKSVSYWKYLFVPLSAIGVSLRRGSTQR